MGLNRNCVGAGSRKERRPGLATPDSAGRGTEVLATMVRGWTEASPQHGVISDDIANMYNTTGHRSQVRVCLPASPLPTLNTCLPCLLCTTCRAIIWFGAWRYV
eukprot:3086557-Prymnesium_polylepis.1